MKKEKQNRFKWNETRAAKCKETEVKSAQHLQSQTRALKGIECVTCLSMPDRQTYKREVIPKCQPA